MIFLSPRDEATSQQQRDIEYQRALTKTILTVSLACLFGAGVMFTRGVSSGYEFFAGYLIEQSLSIDNLFVFLMLFDYFKVPINLQNRVLSWGIGGAILLRGLMIGVGVAALQKFRSVILVFAGILIASSVNLLLEGTQDETHDSAAAGENVIMKLTKFIFPNTSGELHGEDFFVKNDRGQMIATPLLLCLVCVELSDFVFAVDSIPAVLGVSKDPLIVYASNIFAIMALRSLYTVLAKAVSNFHYLKPAVALVLGFVGIKMVGEYYHYEISTGMSLVVICTVLGGGVIASILENRQQLGRNTKKGDVTM
jgi:integral membrane protein, TerC family